MGRSWSGFVTVSVRWLPRRLRAWLFDCCATIPGTLGVTLRLGIARSLAAVMGERVHIGRFCTILRWEGLKVGERVSLHEYCYLQALGGIEIGNDVSIAHGCSLVSFEHSYTNTETPIRDQPLALAPIRLGSDIWLGSGVRVLAGVELGDRTVVAAGAVVTRSSSGGELLGGIPARPIKVIGKPSR